MRFRLERCFYGLLLKVLQVLNEAVINAKHCKTQQTKALLTKKDYRRIEFLQKKSSTKCRLSDWHSLPMKTTCCLSEQTQPTNAHKTEDNGWGLFARSVGYFRLSYICLCWFGSLAARLDDAGTRLLMLTRSQVKDADFNSLMIFLKEFKLL